MSNKKKTTEWIIPLTGKLIDTVIKTFCHKPIQGDDTWEHCSLGIAENSLVATDTRSAIMIGEDAELHVATQRREALVEAYRAEQYGDPVRFDQIDRNCDQATGVAKPMPHVRKVIATQLQSMKALATVDPAALLAIGKVATTAGAASVELLQPDSGETNVLGFRFTFYPHQDHMTLFSEFEGTIKACGVFRTLEVQQTSANTITVEIKEGEDVEAPVKKSRKRTPKEENQPVVNEQTEERSEATAVAPMDFPVDASEQRERHGLNLPVLNILHEYPVTDIPKGEHKDAILGVLRSFNLVGHIDDLHIGPTVTQYEVKVPPGQAAKKIAQLSDDLQLQLGVKSVRIQAPIPGKQAIGIEIPNSKGRIVGLREVCAQHAFVDTDTPLTVALGVDIAGRPIYGDLASMPHLLIAGATNSGKSIGIASILISLLLRNTPRDLKLVLIDPKQVELSLFEDLPHLMCPVITEMEGVTDVLTALVSEMENRYEILKERKVRNIDSYNAAVDERDRLPYVVVVIDELAELMMQIKDSAEPLIVRLAQKARAVGIHLVIATQRPSVDVVTGLIKANVPSRIAFAVASQTDSRVVLDENGAEKLLGKGDLLAKLLDGAGKTVRLQGPYVSEKEVEEVCNLWKVQQTPNYDIRVKRLAATDDDSGRDALFQEAGEFAIERDQLSTSMLQRHFSIGFQRASKILDQLEAHGLLGPRDGPRPRAVQMDLKKFRGSL